MENEADAIDQLLEAWRGARPDLDPTPLGLIGRILVLAKHLEKNVEQALAAHELTLGQFDILATLRRQPEGTGLSPGQLLASVMLSSGGMTNRLDKLEAQGLIARRADPKDRRAVIVALTEKGRDVIDAATETRFREARSSLPDMTEAETAIMTGLLRRWLACYRVEPANHPPRRRDGQWPPLPIGESAPVSDSA